MTKVLPLILGTTFMLANGMARATTVYDSVNVDSADFNAGSDAIAPTQTGPNAASFSSAVVQFMSAVSLELSASSPNDGGSLTVVLMSDNNGNPPYNPPIPALNLPTHGITTFNGGTVLATILDSSLSSAPSLVTINTSVALATGTYWIGVETPLLPTSITDVVNGTYGSAQWWWTGNYPTGASGLAGQQDFSALGGPSSFAVSGNGALGPYEMIVDTTQSAPEPGTLAVFGTGLAAFGSIRRRARPPGPDRNRYPPPPTSSNRAFSSAPSSTA